MKSGKELNPTKPLGIPLLGESLLRLSCARKGSNKAGLYDSSQHCGPRTGANCLELSVKNLDLES